MAKQKSCAVLKLDILSSAVLITDLTVFLTLVRVISRVSGIGSGAMTAARLFLTSGSISLPLWEGNSETDKQRNTNGGLTTVNCCHVLLNVKSKVTSSLCVYVCVCVRPWCPCWTLTQIMILTMQILQKFFFLLQSLFYKDKSKETYSMYKTSKGRWWYNAGFMLSIHDTHGWKMFTSLKNPIMIYWRIFISFMMIPKIWLKNCDQNMCCLVDKLETLVLNYLKHIQYLACLGCNVSVLISQYNPIQYMWEANISQCVCGLKDVFSKSALLLQTCPANYR